MNQRATTGAHADATTGAASEFEPDVMDLLVEALRDAVKRESPVVGTDTVLAALVMGDTDAGAAIAPGMRASGALSGVISGRAGRGWQRAETEAGVSMSQVPGDSGPLAVRLGRGAAEAVAGSWAALRTAPRRTVLAELPLCALTASLGLLPLLLVRPDQPALAVLESAGTVKAHISRILTRTGCANRVMAAVLAHDAGLLTER